MNANDHSDEGVHTPKTLLAAIRHFADPVTAHEYMVNLRWPKGVSCPRCGSKHISFISSRRIWKCLECPGHKQFSVKVGTVMEDSPLPIDKWLIAVWMEANCKNSISSYELHRALGITQKSAWFLLHRVRHAVKTGSFEKLGGAGNPIEADETAIGGLAKNMHRSRRARVVTGTGSSGKTIVMGLLERHTTKGKSRVRATVIPNVQRDTLHDVIHKNVQPGAQIYTDAFSGYQPMDGKFFHDFVDHMEKYVDGQVHTNGMENFWTLFKRCIKGTHVSVDPAHLLAYVDSEAFRFNHRDLNDGGRFLLAVKGIPGKRLTYNALIGKDVLGGTHDAKGADGANSGPC